MTGRRALRAVSFLGAAAAPHYAACAGRLAASVGLRAGPLEQPGLEQLDATLADGAPAILFLCGLPYVRAVAAGADLRLLAAPVPAGSGAPVYRSELVVRTASARLPDAVAGRVGFNGRDSLSGWVLPRAGLRRRGLDVDAIAWTRTGSHAASLDALVDGDLEAAVVDSTVLALERRRDPSIAALACASCLGEAPSPPVLLAGGDAGLESDLRAALLALPEDAEGQTILELGGLARYAPVADQAYDAVRILDRAET